MSSENDIKADMVPSIADATRVRAQVDPLLLQAREHPVLHAGLPAQASPRIDLDIAGVRVQGVLPRRWRSRSKPFSTGWQRLAIMKLASWMAKWGLAPEQPSSPFGMTMTCHWCRSLMRH